MNTDNPERHPGNLRTLELTPREVKPLLKYGYPFEEQAQALRSSRSLLDELDALCDALENALTDRPKFYLVDQA